MNWDWAYNIRRLWGWARWGGLECEAARCGRRQAGFSLFCPEHTAALRVVEGADIEWFNGLPLRRRVELVEWAGARRAVDDE